MYLRQLDKIMSFMLIKIGNGNDEYEVAYE
jgi:hypothetical protein